MKLTILAAIIDYELPDSRARAYCGAEVPNLVRIRPTVLMLFSFIFSFCPSSSWI